MTLTFLATNAYLRFVFLTGVTKFSKVSIFSDLNQLQDISMSEAYASIARYDGKQRRTL
ncbi:MAG: AAA family ATPase [Tannerellaceae bacterium]|nr:AAA family ATPase [Tannerellaceae bacterium]